LPESRFNSLAATRNSSASIPRSTGPLWTGQTISTQQGITHLISSHHAQLNIITPRTT
jgi:hypothetical protein